LLKFSYLRQPELGKNLKKWKKNFDLRHFKRGEKEEKTEGEEKKKRRRGKSRKRKKGEGKTPRDNHVLLQGVDVNLSATRLVQGSPKPGRCRGSWTAGSPDFRGPSNGIHSGLCTPTQL